MKEIMVTNYNKGMFQSKNLNTATDALVKAANGINKNIKTMCIVLWRVLDTKAYEEEGMKSLAEYAERIGFDKSLAHKYADAGKLYDSNDEEIKTAVADMDFTKVQLLKSLPEETVKNGLKSGKVSNEKTAKEIAEWKAAEASKPKEDAPKQEKVEEQFRITGFYIPASYKVNFQLIREDSMSIEELFRRYVGEKAFDSKNHVVRNPADNKVVMKATIVLIEDGSVLSYQATPTKGEKVPRGKAKDLDKMSDEEFIEYCKKRGLNVQHAVINTNN